MATVLVLFAAAVFGASCGNATGESVRYGNTPPAPSARPHAEEVSERVTAQPSSEATTATAYPVVGTLRARRTTRVGSQLSGRVDEVLVDVGDFVEAGQPIVKLDAKFYDLEVRERAAELAAARAAHAEAEVYRQRLEELWNRPSGEPPLAARHEVDSAIFRAAEAAARVDLAEKLLAHATERLAETVIRAPYAGIVTARLVKTPC